MEGGVSVETCLEGNKLNLDEWSMPNTPPEFHFIGVFLGNLLVYDMAA